MDDSELLRSYSSEKSEEAFRHLTDEKIGLVYSAALRQVGGDAHAAQEVTQTVFITLARKAAQLVSHPSLTGWLYATTRFEAAKIMRTNARRRVRETVAYTMNQTPDAGREGGDVTWERVAPIVDDAMHELELGDRNALLLRFFEGHTLAIVGYRLQLTEDGARRRIERALDKLRGNLARRGITCTSAVLLSELGRAAICSVPAGLAAAATGAALLAGGSFATAVAAFIAMNKIKIGMIVGIVGVATIVVVRSQTVSAPLSPVSNARNGSVQITSSGQTEVQPGTPSQVAANVAPPAATATAEDPKPTVPGLPAEVTAYRIEGVSLAERQALTIDKVMAERQPEGTWKTFLTAGATVTHRFETPNGIVEVSISVATASPTNLSGSQIVKEYKSDGTPMSSVSGTVGFTPNQKGWVSNALHGRPGNAASSTEPTPGSTRVMTPKGAVYISAQNLMDGHFVIITTGDWTPGAGG